MTVQDTLKSGDKDTAEILRVHKMIASYRDTAAAAVELGDEVSHGIDLLIDDMENFLKESLCQGYGQITIDADRLIDLFSRFNGLMVKASSLGRMCAGFSEVEKSLMASKAEIAKIQEAADPGTPIQSISYLTEGGDDWITKSVEEFLDLSLLDRAAVLVRCKRKFIDAEGNEIPESAALRSLRSVIGSASDSEGFIFDVSKSHDGAMSVLLVDDEPIVAEAISRKLKRKFPQGLNIVVANSGPEALKILCGNHEEKSIRPPFLVFLDIQMPGMDGLQVLRKIRETESISKSVVFILTASTRNEIEEQAKSLNCAGYLKKQRLHGDLRTIVGLINLYRELQELPKVHV